MGAFFASCRARGLLRLAPIALIASGLAACSSDIARFNDNALSNPYASRPPEPAPAGGYVDAKPLPPPPRSDVTGTVARAGKGEWDWDGGTAVTVAPGDTIASLSHKYHVPAAVIMQANGIRPGSPLPPGQRLVIPRHHGEARVASAAGTHVVAAGENLSTIAHRYHKPRAAIAKANGLPPDARLRIGQRLTIPGLKAAPIAAAPAKPGPVAGARPGEPRAAPAAPTNPKVAANDPPASARIATPTPTIETESGAGEAAPGAPSFRWPVRGRIISAFGAHSGQQNDGIDLSVPEGTSVKAADDGVVAYAGNELKGYGNLVLVRHQNGYVTAYAHASELMVKRGDQVKRGQIIARSGQTGNVTAPQLHFEIRKGKVPVDPTQFLPAT
ncbi:MAG TPA: LysM peptidoglycan-binding domain-containing M23 family metallopeptidase [Xanthobacteraceae bacterium]|jgi:murein DD-endopeptidase MepM/ murein hydrolase activator NlpD|nr:LysM peptidoglycan-binding domain-containing M23 family metallopeptidase [Xanthobacteraceae bacterium]